MTYDVFISYSSQDQKIVEGICGYLEARGIRCFVAYRDIPRGVVWARAIVEALDESRIMVVAFSDNFNRSEQVDREIELASEDHKPILTFRLSDSKFEGAKKYYLKNLNWIDAFPAPDQAFAYLYDNICRLLGIHKQPTSSLSSSSSGTVSASNTSPSNHNNSNRNTIETDVVFDPVTGTFKLGPANGGEISASFVEHKNTIGLTEDQGLINGHQYVDLGLPSGLKWATCNVGADYPDEFGSFFAWGEIRPKSRYTHDNSETYEAYEAWLLDNGFIDKEGNLTMAHDAARQNWGGPWRMPTRKEIKELLDHTSSSWGRENGVPGRFLTSNINSNYIFLPASGWKENGNLDYQGDNGYYWSASIHNKNVHAAYDLFFSASYIRADWGMRSGGFNIRPVSE